MKRPGITQTNRAAARHFVERMMRPLTLEQIFGPAPSGPAPIARPTPAPKNARAATGEARQAVAPQTEPPSDLGLASVGVYTGKPSLARNITDEFRNDPTTTNWRADERRRGLL